MSMIHHDKTKHLRFECLNCTNANMLGAPAILIREKSLETSAANLVFGCNKSVVLGRVGSDSDASAITKHLHVYSGNVVRHSNLRGREMKYMCGNIRILSCGIEISRIP